MPIKLIMLPFAGGASHAYAGLAACLPSFVRPLALDLPGHGRRLAEPLLDDLTAMAHDIWRQMTPHLAEPYALLGHSMGATLAYLVARQALAEHAAPPCHLFLSGRGGPLPPPQRPPLHTLDRQAFLTELDKLFGNIPEQLRQSAELQDIFEPIMRADFRAVETCQPMPEQPRPAIAADVFLAQNDPAGAQAVQPWERALAGPVHGWTFPGGHFFIFEQWPAMARIVARRLAWAEAS